MEKYEFKNDAQRKNIIQTQLEQGRHLVAEVRRDKGDYLIFSDKPYFSFEQRLQALEAAVFELERRGQP